MSAETIVPVILSGGSGSRLWPVSRQLFPKQLLPLPGPNSMIQETALRVADKARYAPAMIIANEAHRFIIAEQMRALGLDGATMLLEPAGRNTAPAVALAAYRLLADRDDALMLVLPSDHLIQDRAAFDAAVDIAANAAAQGKLVTFGMAPDKPETGFGYIRQGPPIKGIDGAFAVDRFVEKPAAETAEAMLAEGGFHWNSGMFLFSAKVFVAELERLAPDIASAVRESVVNRQSDLDFERPDADSFVQARSISIDYAIMEKTDRAAVVPATLGWSDVGSWTALWDVADRDDADNATKGDVMAIDSEGCLLHAEGPAIAAVGLRDILVVSTKDAVLVAAKDRAQDVKQIVEQLKADERYEHLHHPRVYRPWGNYETVDLGPRFQTKRIVVEPGRKLSLQKHHHRAEHWIVVQGTALVTRDEDQILLTENESVYIPLGAVHRLENPGKIPLHLIEVQSGSYLGEDDIVRLEDDYKRSKTGAFS